MSQKKKKLDSVVGGWGLSNPSFSRIFGFFLTWQDPFIELVFAIKFIKNKYLDYYFFLSHT